MFKQETYAGWKNYADAYLDAAKILAECAPTKQGNGCYFNIGPLSQTLGMGSELTMKAALLKFHFTPDKMRTEFRHDLIAIFEELSRQAHDDMISLQAEVALFLRDNHVSIPSYFHELAESQGRDPLEYYLIGTHLEPLSRNYCEDVEDGDRFRTRYFDPKGLFRIFNADVIYYGMRRIRAFSDSLSA